MIGVDTNLLVYAHRRDSTWHDRASRILQELAEGQDAWAIPWPCLHEFIAIVTHPRIFDPPTSVDQALAQVAAWIESPSLVLLAEAAGYWVELRNTLTEGRVTGARVHDARIAALCALHGDRELWTADRDFDRFSTLRTRNPLVG